MVRTRVGYAGGRTRHPSYHDMGDHAETTEIDFDPRVTSYGAMLEAFWNLHVPTRRAYSRQYMSAIFPRDGEQRRVAEASMARVAAMLGRPVYTEISMLDAFHRAEDYHQKYYLRHDRTLMRAFAGYSERAFEDSTVAARLNALVSGEGDVARIRAELPRFGLSAECERRVIDLAGAPEGHGIACPTR